MEGMGWARVAFGFVRAGWWGRERVRERERESWVGDVDGGGR